ncbi:hypothetical protein ACOI1H_14595 [Loktanella sp. DJP18]|uniref:hypothetical protein n=1 Tax=Loktanella sp. DJP18 TaxID=3409788 RepID=UPI003BB7A45E
MKKNELSVDGVITAIKFRDTRRGARYATVRVSSPQLQIEVDVFDRCKVSELAGTHIGDRMIASGPGFHRGTIRCGTTSITARDVVISRDDAGRSAHRPAQQMSLF